jgi:uncharacterized Zn finger protein
MQVHKSKWTVPFDHKNKATATLDFEDIKQQKLQRAAHAIESARAKKDRPKKTSKWAKRDADFDENVTSYDPYEWSAPQDAEPRVSTFAPKTFAIDHAEPVVPTSRRNICSTFWGKAWCDHLQTFHGYENRLPRGKTYLFKGAVADLKISSGLVLAKVAGSRLYEVEIKIKTLPPDRWLSLVNNCGDEITSLSQLLAAEFSPSFIEKITHVESGMFPMPADVSIHCTCPDYATVCKHVAATLYGVGVRLDEHPDLFFTLRAINGEDFFRATAEEIKSEIEHITKENKLDTSALSDLFGIDLMDT